MLVKAATEAMAYAGLLGLIPLRASTCPTESTVQLVDGCSEWIQLVRIHADEKHLVSHLRETV